MTQLQFLQAFEVNLTGCVCIQKKPQKLKVFPNRFEYSMMMSKHDTEWYSVVCMSNICREKSVGESEFVVGPKKWRESESPSGWTWTLQGWFRTLGAICHCGICGLVSLNMILDWPKILGSGWTQRLVGCRNPWNTLKYSSHKSGWKVENGGMFER